MENWKALQTLWPHLEGLDIPEPVGKGEADIIIGTHHAHLLASLKADITGKEKTDPIAKCTPLGVFIMGKTDPENSQTQLGKTLIARGSKVLLLKRSNVCQSSFRMINRTVHNQVKDKGQQETEGGAAPVTTGTTPIIAPLEATATGGQQEKPLLPQGTLAASATGKFKKVDFNYKPSTGRAETILEQLKESNITAAQFTLHQERKLEQELGGIIHKNTLLPSPGCMRSEQVLETIAGRHLL